MFVSGKVAKVVKGIITTKARLSHINNQCKYYFYLPIYSQTPVLLSCTECLSVNFVEVPGNLGHLERGDRVCDEQGESSADRRWWFPVFCVSSIPIPALISLSFYIFFTLGIYITVLDFIISMASYLYFSQNDIIFTYCKERYSNIS